MNDPLLNAYFGIWMGRFFKIWAKFGKILEKLGKFAQDLAQNCADWYMNGLLFLEELVFLYGSTFKFVMAPLYQNQTFTHLGPNLRYAVTLNTWDVLKFEKLQDFVKLFYDVLVNFKQEITIFIKHQLPVQGGRKKQSLPIENSFI